MTRVIARAALMVVLFGLMLGNYWYTFGLWPRSWTAFVLFGLAITAVHACHDLIKAEERRGDA